MLTTVDRSFRARVARFYLVAVCGIAAIGIGTSLGWIGVTFPGFFVMPNRVIPSVGLAHWSGGTSPAIFQHQVLAIDERPVATAAEVYTAVAAAPTGRDFTYRLARGADAEARTIPSMTFRWRDYVEMFGPLILNGITFTAVGLAISMLGGPSAATIGAMIFTLDVGLFCLTALDLYGPGNFFRLHVATEALMPVTLTHLLLVFPVVRLGSRRAATLRVLYGAGAVVVGIYEWVLYAPAAYSAVHNVCMAAVGAAGLAMTASCAHGYLTSTSLLVRRRLAIIAFGLVCGFGIPAWVILLSAYAGGQRSLNVAAFTAFAFPLSLAYAVVKHDLFEIDALLRRGVSYVALTTLVVSVYTAMALVSGLVMRRLDLEQSAIFPVAFTIVMVFFVQPLRARMQTIIDRMYSRSRYDPRRTLEDASAKLVATLDLDDICRLTLDTVGATFAIATISVWLRDGDRFVVAVSRGFGRLTLPSDHMLVQRLRCRSRGVSVHDFAERRSDDPTARSCLRTLALLQADLALPIGSGDLVGFVTLGPKLSQSLYTLEDIGFLSTFLNQVATAVRNAQAYRQIEDLNEGLERKVADRTSELASANQRLGDSVSQLEGAFGDLKRSQEELMRAERLATLGQLAAGIAHEVNTPLGAALNALKISRELADEYAASIGDPAVEPEDHQAIAVELRTQLDDIQRWTSTAAAFVRTIKNHTHEAGEECRDVFDVRKVLDDVRLLLAHRLRLSSCALTVECPEHLTLYGDAGKLAQVITNLVANAVDACDENANDGGAVTVRVANEATTVRLTVADNGCGIPADRLERVFDALFTTKPRGKGTGLGLALCRDIVERRFGGTITVDSTPGVGSRFTLLLPHSLEMSVGGEQAPAA